MSTGPILPQHTHNRKTNSPRSYIVTLSRSNGGESSQPLSCTAELHSVIKLQFRGSCIVLYNKLKYWELQRFTHQWRQRESCSVGGRPYSRVICWTPRPCFSFSERRTSQFRHRVTWATSALDWIVLSLKQIHTRCHDDVYLIERGQLVSRVYLQLLGSVFRVMPIGP